jgi:hypothetical protein
MLPLCFYWTPFSFAILLTRVPTAFTVIKTLRGVWATNTVFAVFSPCGAFDTLALERFHRRTRKGWRNRAIMG